MLVSIFILILFLPAAFLPVALDAFTSSADLDEMGISLESSDDTFPMQGYELAVVPPISNNISDSGGYVWDISEQFQTCQ